jgi:ferredoxin
VANGAMARRYKTVRVVVDTQACESNALCMGVAPEIFDVPNEGPVEVLNEHPSEDMRAEAEEAARVCPTQAITIED